MSYVLPVRALKKCASYEFRNDTIKEFYSISVYLTTSVLQEVQKLKTPTMKGFYFCTAILYKLKY